MFSHLLCFCSKKIDGTLKVDKLSSEEERIDQQQVRPAMQIVRLHSKLSKATPTFSERGLAVRNRGREVAQHSARGAPFVEEGVPAYSADVEPKKK